MLLLAKIITDASDNLNLKKSAFMIKWFVDNKGQVHFRVLLSPGGLGGGRMTFKLKVGLH